MQINVDKRSIDRLESLVNVLAASPAKIQLINATAADISTTQIKENILKRGPAGRAVKVERFSYGQYGVKIKITYGGTRGGNTGGRPKSGRYSIIWGARVFLAAEEGKVGRRAFTLPKKLSLVNDRMGGYRISHTSGKWRKGRRLKGQLKIPQIGPYYFSSKSQMKREKISTMSRNIVKKNLNNQYSRLLKRSGE